MEKKEDNYRFTIYLEEWTSNQGFVITNQLMDTRAISLEKAKALFEKLKTLLENEK